MTDMERKTFCEREALLDSICHETCRIAFCGATNCAFMAKVCSAPVADVAPVVHGRWIPFHSEIAGDIQYCSACEIGFATKTDYCPHCGAKMDGGDENG